MTRRAKLLALLDANAAFASVVNVKENLMSLVDFVTASRDFAFLSYSNCIRPSCLACNASVILSTLLHIS